MTECCSFDDAVIRKIGSLSLSPVKAEKVFLGERRGDCLPYAVAQTSSAPGLRTSDGVQKIYTLSVQAFFAKERPAEAYDFKSIVEEWIYSGNCISLGDCGCLCVRSIGNSRVVPQADGLMRYEATVTGVYQTSPSS